MFNIVKFCENNRNNASYLKVVTSGNNPQISQRMRYSQYVKSNKYRNVNTSTVEAQLAARGIIEY